ncbi:hypothetical protein [Clostridium beijerinckii]|uniref:hypothetical protein n=1 Tax=Clostridium beijerinckii TaxID=1520 RepID=UPI00098C7364|nr:hypothetical protein [Clostridium beijerinckii]NRT76034.1 hypothetical protein [Clostridium beijerinckii]OOM37060.1 hypothetical protein CBEIJ_50320 [Clostridium beijerinckii]
MDFNYIETLVTRCKDNDDEAKEKLVYDEMCDYEDLKLALKNLNKEEVELIDFIFYKNYTVKKYAYFKNMCYSTAIQRNKNILMKILNNISLYY